ncbi:MAG: hydroxymethylpyrimidine/phosphomethylpyrimidine kinase [bacterium]|nr:hydroxymethylpyrimidine/phosphomethylpyrimidine kinase [bacterium]
MTTSIQLQPTNPDRKEALLTIAGFDPTAGAGILMDSAVFRALGFHPLAVLTSVAAQGTNGVAQVQPLSAAFIKRELQIIQDEFHLGAIKIGMLYSAGAIKAVGLFLRASELPVVLDPVLTASGGGALIVPHALRTLEKELFPYCQLITPNLDEAESFSGTRLITITDMETCAGKLSKRWGCAVLLKGGHLQGEVVDVLADNGKITRFPHQRQREGLNVRGTGCALAAAVAAFLSKGIPLSEAVGAGIRFVESALAGAYSTGYSSNVGFLNLPEALNPI